MGEDGRAVHFSVVDDGAGFDPAAVEHASGLANIRDRVAAADGTVSIDAQPGRGTRISAALPG